MNCVKCNSNNVNLIKQNEPIDFDDEYICINKFWKCQDCGEEFMTKKTVCAHIED